MQDLIASIPNVTNSTSKLWKQDCAFAEIQFNLSLLVGDIMNSRKSYLFHIEWTFEIDFNNRDTSVTIKLIKNNSRNN